MTKKKGKGQRLSINAIDNTNKTLYVNEQTTFTCFMENLNGTTYHSKNKVPIDISLVYASNPYSKTNNPKNIAFGSRLLASPYLMLNYNKPKLIGPIGIQSGLLLFHASNGNFKTPNTSVNTISFIFYEVDSSPAIKNQIMIKILSCNDFMVANIA